MRFTTSAAALAASLSIATAQTFTDCNPLEKTCPNDTGLPSKVFTSDFTDGKGAAASWSLAAYSTLKYGSNGAEFSIAKDGQAPTMETDFYIFFGRVDVKMRAAPGQGIVSSIVLESDDLDEIDWEFIGGDSTQVQTNFFGKGNTTVYDRMEAFDVSDTENTFHTYTLDWNSDRLLYIIDGKTVRTLEYNDPLAVYGKNYPQTPMKLKLGSWCGGCEGQPNGTVEWAGGKTTFDNAPYVMYVESVNIQNYNPADSYSWTDKSGSWESIKIINDGKESSPTGTVTGATSVTATGKTSAPTKGHTVTKVNNSGVVGPTSGYSNASSSMQTSVVQATTQVPGATPTDGGFQQGSGTGSATPSATGTGGAASNGAVVSSVLVGLLFSVLLL
jgi:beta-glucanase (GH16 family)